MADNILTNVPGVRLTTYGASAANSVPAVNSKRFQVIDLSPFHNNDAISTAANPSDGSFNIWGNSFPAEGLPAGGSIQAVHSAPFLFPLKEDGALNNVVCQGQYIPLQETSIDWVHLLAASERRAEDLVHVHYADGSVDPEWIRVSDFWPSSPHFGELLGFRFSTMHYPRHVQARVEGQMWMTRVPVVRRTPLVGLRLPVNVAMHIFALTLEEAA